MKKLYVKIFKRDYCLEGFPKNVESHVKFLKQVQKRGGEFRFVKCHYNSEKGSAKLHTIMHQLGNEKLITIDHGTGDKMKANDTLFLIRLTTKGVERIRMAQDRFVGILMLLFIFLQFVLALYGIIYH